jgi:hypothetical protein
MMNHINEAGQQFFAPITSSRRTGVRMSLVASAFAICLFSVAASQAASINYGDFAGATVMYTQVTESSITDPVPLFGAPTVSGDSIDFTPVDFAASSQLHVPAVDQTDGHLVFGVMANPLATIKNINFEEGGGLTVGGFGTNMTFVDVSAVGNIDIFQVDGVNISKLTIPIDLKFSFGNNGTSDNGEWHLVPQGFVNGAWTGSQLVDITGYLHTHGYPNAIGATKIQVAIDNKLYAQSEIEGTATIDKKDFGGLSVTVNIPEPATLSLLVFGFVGLVAARRSGR